MSSLQVRLDRIKKSFVDSAPPAAVAVMTRATEELRRSGILGRMAGVGSQLPAFALSDSDGKQVRSEDLLARGPLVLTFYRGLW